MASVNRSKPQKTLCPEFKKRYRINIWLAVLQQQITNVQNATSTDHILGGMDIATIIFKPSRLKSRTGRNESGTP